MIILIVLTGICLIPTLVIKLKSVGSPVIILFTNIIIPFTAGSFILVGGVYDKVVIKVENLLDIKQ